MSAVKSRKLMKYFVGLVVLGYGINVDAYRQFVRF